MPLIRQRPSPPAPASWPSPAPPPPVLPDTLDPAVSACPDATEASPPWIFQSQTIFSGSSKEGSHRIWLLSNGKAGTDPEDRSDTAFANLSRMLEWCHSAPESRRRSEMRDDAALPTPDLIVARLHGASPDTDVEQLTELRRTHDWCRHLPIVAIADYLNCRGVIQMAGVFFVSSATNAHAVRQLLRRCLNMPKAPPRHLAAGDN